MHHAAFSVKATNLHGLERKHFRNHGESMPESHEVTLSEAASTSLGERLRTARKLRGLRLREVATGAGCSESLVSKIECDKAYPSLQTLHRLAEVLGTTVAALFSPESGQGLTVYREGERPVLRLSAPGGSPRPSLERMVPHAEGRTLNGNIHVVPPGSGSEGALRHEGEEIGYVLEGTIELVVDGRAVTLGRGDSFFFPSLLPHSYRNVGREVARVIWVNSPPY
jgi:transcriptional regulator with XRE-family HTH domain